MAAGDAESQRLAEQRREDLRRAEAERERIVVAAARKDERDQAHTAEQDRHLEAINGSIDRCADNLKALELRIAKVELLLEKRDAVAVAAAEMAAKGVTNRTFILSACVLAVMIVALFLGAGGHP